MFASEVAFGILIEYSLLANHLFLDQAQFVDFGLVLVDHRRNLIKGALVYLKGRPTAICLVDRIATARYLKDLGARTGLVARIRKHSTGHALLVTLDFWT